MPAHGLPDKRERDQVIEVDDPLAMIGLGPLDDPRDPAAEIEIRRRLRRLHWRGRYHHPQLPLLALDLGFELANFLAGLPSLRNVDHVAARNAVKLANLCRASSSPVCPSDPALCLVVKLGLVHGTPSRCFVFCLGLWPVDDPERRNPLCALGDLLHRAQLAELVKADAFEQDRQMRVGRTGLFGLDLEWRFRAGNVLRRGRKARAVAERNHFLAPLHFVPKLWPGRGERLGLPSDLASRKPVSRLNDRLIRQASAQPPQRRKQDVVILVCLGETVPHFRDPVLR